MTDATVLADALVEAGILTKSSDEHNQHNTPVYRCADTDVGCAKQFITDGRVVMKVLEVIDSGSIVNCDDAQLGMWSVMFNGKQAMGNNLHQTIIEAWYEARQ